MTVLGRLALALPLPLRLSRLVLFGVLFGCAADAVTLHGEGVFRSHSGALAPYTGNRPLRDWCFTKTLPSAETLQKRGGAV